MMNYFKSIFYTYFILFASLANAAVINVTADYNPANYDPRGAVFINTTPCTQSLVGWCSGNATIENPQSLHISTFIQRKILDDGNKRNGISYLAFPAVRQVTLTRQGGGESFIFDFIFTDIGSQIGRSNSFSPYTHKGDCVSNLFTASASVSFTFSKIKESSQLSGGVCYSDDNYLSSEIKLYSVYLGYKIKSADPLKMPNGTYTGKTVFSIGEYKDLDFGAGVYSDNQLVLNFRVTVKHQLKVEFPSSVSQIELIPPGGWKEWMHRGKVNPPPYIAGEVPYKMWASSNYSMLLKCGVTDGINCFVVNESTGHRARLVVTNISGTGEQQTLSPKYTRYFPVELDGIGLISEQKRLIFKVEKAVLKEMINYPGSSYKGDVTVIYDASI